MIRFFQMLFIIGMIGSLGLWAMYRQGIAKLRPWWVLVLFWLMPGLFVLGNVGINLLPRALIRIVAWISGVWVGFFFYSILLLPVFLLIWLIGKICHKPKAAPLAARLFLAFNVAFTAFGFWRATHPVVRELTYQTDKALPGPYKIVFVSDLHFGGLFGMSYGEALAQHINDQKPDLVLIGGDIVDRDLPFVKREGSLKTLAAIKAKDGVFAVFGNHDRMAGTSAEERKLLEAEGIPFLVDENRKINEVVNLTGLDDYRMGNRYAQFAPEPGKFNILLEHEPMRIKEAAAKDYELYFAGHTHAGQLFPIRLITKKMYDLDYGSQYFEQMLTTVSSGYGLWGIPVRTGPMPEIVVVTVEKR